MTDKMHAFEEVGELPPKPPQHRRRNTAEIYAAELETVRCNPGSWFRLADFTDKAQPWSSAHQLKVRLERQTTGLEIVARGGCVYIRAEVAS